MKSESNTYQLLQRPRRNRVTEPIRRLVQETRLHTDNLIFPLFLMDGSHIRQEVKSLPGIYKFSLDNLLKEIEECKGLGINSFILFPAVKEALKDKEATYSYDSENFYLKAASEIKRQFGQDVVLISDVAMDPYNSDGHDGYVEKGKIVNDKTLPILGKMAVAQAEAGFDILGPSDMMDGRVRYIREQLDQNGYYETGIMSYTAKYASAFYGPFRDALDSAPKENSEIPAHKKSYQMNPANSREALLEAYLDQQEGADYLMVKPALHYLDIICKIREATPLPIAAYHVSGECAMLIAACQNGWLDYEKAMPEALLSIKRAGADAILTYFAKDFAKMMQ